ncbi:MAG: hypothetical protein ACFCUT_06805 [Kiloniellaceae bacterium]
MLQGIRKILGHDQNREGDMQGIEAEGQFDSAYAEILRVAREQSPVPLPTTPLLHESAGYAWWDYSSYQTMVSDGTKPDKPTD